jgi:hypothetical protein
MTTVLHTHSRSLDYHPHCHVIVPGGGVDRARRQWKKAKGKYLFNAFALAKVFRARFLAAIKAEGLPTPDLPEKWVVHCKHIGKGRPALEYLSRCRVGVALILRPQCTVRLGNRTTFSGITTARL